MNWAVPAKTFLVGEYIALSQQPAILLTTKPCFELRLNTSTSRGLSAGSSTFLFHPESPAGLFWAKTPFLHQFGFEWGCPYENKGGLGGSSAEFVALYRAYCDLSKQPFNIQDMLTAYFACQTGKVPSGYDVLAQCHEACVYIDRSAAIIQSFRWPFPSMGFVLVHTGKKLATHTYLQTKALAWPESALITIVKDVWQALSHHNEAAVISGINDYYQTLKDAHLVADHIPPLRESLMKLPGVVAAKGCGAMGADVMLLLCDNQKKVSIINTIKTMKLTILATNEDLS